MFYAEQDALGGNSKTVLVVCCSPDGSDIFETLSTLRFAERAKKVKNTAKVRSTPAFICARVCYLDSNGKIFVIVILYKKNCRSYEGEYYAFSGPIPETCQIFTS